MDTKQVDGFHLPQDSTGFGKVEEIFYGVNDFTKDVNCTFKFQLTCSTTVSAQTSFSNNVTGRGFHLKPISPTF
jgi:hypothetical protein